MPGKKELPQLCGGESLREQSAAIWFQKKTAGFLIAMYRGYVFC